MVEELKFQAEKLKKLLDGRPVTWLATKTGIKSGRLYYILAGNDEPSGAELLALASLFGMEPTELMNSRPPEPKRPRRRATDKEESKDATAA